MLQIRRKCDKCGIEVPDTDDVKAKWGEVSLSLCHVKDASDITNSKRFHLCPKCLKDLGLVKTGIEQFESIMTNACPLVPVSQPENWNMLLTTIEKIVSDTVKKELEDKEYERQQGL